MLNFKFKFIKLGGLFVLAFVLFFHNISLVHGQQAGIGSLRSLNIKDVKIETSDTEIKVSGKLINQSQNIATGKITHLLILETIDSLIKPKNEIDQMPPLIVSAEEGEDYFSLDPNRQKSFSYSLTASEYIPKGNYRLSLSFIRSDGKKEAYYNEIIKDFGSFGKEGFLAFDQQSCVLFGREGEKFGRNSGPAFLPGESPKISCLVKNIGDKEIEVYPNILWKEVFVYGKPLEGKIAEEKHKEKIIFKSGEAKTISLFMPAAKKPQTYQGFLSFEDENGNKRSFSEFFRWTIAGESARVKSVAQTSQLKDFYDKGDVVSLSVDYFGSSDLYWAGAQEVSNLSDLMMKVVIKDKNGNICGEKEETLPEITDGFSKNKIIEVVLDKKCNGMTYSVYLSSGQKSLAEQSGDLPKLVNRQKTLQHFYFGVPAFILLLAFYLFIRKKSVPVYIFIFALAGVAMFSGAVLAETKTFPASGGTVSSWQWGGDWINTIGNVTSILYSARYGDNVNVLNPGYASSQLKGFFMDNTGNGSVEFEYFAKDAGCVNTSMEVEYEVRMGANGEESFLTKERKEYTSNYENNINHLVNIPSDKINWLYNSEGMPKANPKLIVYMKQIGFYGANIEFSDTYEWVGWGNGQYAYNGDTGEYFLYNGGGYDLVITSNNNFYPGHFYYGVSSETTKADAYALSDTIKIEVPLLLPTPTLRIDPPSAVINPGEKKQFRVFYDADGAGVGFLEKDVTAEISADSINNWSSGNTAVVKIKETGEATAVAGGSAKIKAVYYRGLAARAQISVPTLRINPSSITMIKGSGQQLDAYYDEDGKGPLAKKEVTFESVWSSNNSFAASVKKKKGWVTALNEGAANIRADYLGLQALSPVSVVGAPIDLAVSCSSDPASVFLNETTTFTANAFGGTAPYSYIWTGDDGLSGAIYFVDKSYSATGTKNATIEVKDNVGAVATNSCSADVVNNKTIGECDIAKNKCLVGDVNNIHENQTQYLWECVGTQSTDYCSLDKTAYYIDPTYAEVEVENSQQFDGWYDNGNGVFEQIVSSSASWTSSVPNTASVDSNGKVYCAKEGQVNIDSTYKGITAVPSAVVDCVKYPVKEYALTVKKIGNGYVSGGVDCGASCFKANIALNTKTSLHAQASEGYFFKSFSVVDVNDGGVRIVSDCDKEYVDEKTENNACDLTIDSHKEVTVMFEPDGTIGECSTTEKNKCLVGTVDNANEDKTQFLWECVGTKESVSCYFDKVSAWITATPLEVYEGSVVAVEWRSSENAISCEHLDGGNDSEWKKINKSATSGLFTTSSLGKTNRTYAIKCTDNISVAEDSVEIKIIEPKGDITITVNDINATIVAGLMAKSYYSKKAGEENLKVSDNGGCKIGSLELTANYSKTDKDAGGDFVFNPANNGSFPYNGNFYVKNILGKTPEGKYPITLTATCILNTTGEKIGKTAEINLTIKKILSDWLEF